MAVKGKRKYSFYLDEKNVEILRNHFDGRPGSGGISEFLDKHVARSVKIVKMNPKAFKTIEPGKMTFKKFWQLAKMDVS